MNYTNKDIRKLTNFSTRQITHLSECRVIEPDVADSSGQGSVRLYSRMNLLQFLVAKSFRNLGLEWRYIKSAIRMIPFFTEEELEWVPCIFHYLNRDRGFLEASNYCHSRLLQILDDSVTESLRGPQYSVSKSTSDSVIFIHKLQRQLNKFCLDQAYCKVEG